ncbi:T9SS type A sorting domain-containing protein, partial [Flavobacterium lindanitolerans]
DGTLWAWGRNDYGQLGDGTTIDKSTPIQIGVLSDWLQIEAKEALNIAIKTNGTLWSWGLNRYEENAEYIDTPVQVGADNNWSKISCGFTHIIALKMDGTLWGWGGNGVGQLGDDSAIVKINPTQIGTANDWSKIATGYMHTVALKTDGTLWAWGDNQWGWLGDGTTIGKTTPTRIGTDADWSQITASNTNTIALKTDGTLWTWGANYFGQLGNNGNPNGRNIIPIQLGTATNWSQIKMGYMHVIALKADNTLLIWGANSFGQVGDGTTNDRYTPREIGCSALSVDNPVVDLEMAQIYPNPVNAVLNIETSLSQLEKIELYDMQGRLILIKNTKTETKTLLDISNVISGSYIVKLFTDKGIQNAKIIKN